MKYTHTHTHKMPGQIRPITPSSTTVDPFLFWFASSLVRGRVFTQLPLVPAQSGTLFFLFCVALPFSLSLSRSSVQQKAIHIRSGQLGRTVPPGVRVGSSCSVLGPDVDIFHSIKHGTINKPPLPRQPDRKAVCADREAGRYRSSHSPW